MADAAEIRRRVVRHLFACFEGSLNDHDAEDLAQGALEAMLRHERSGHEIREPIALAKQIAWRDARDLLQRRGTAVPQPIDPQSHEMRIVADPGRSVEERLVERAELGRAIEAAERLSLEQQVVYRSRFVEELKPREACRRLGIHRQTYYSRLAVAVARVERSLRPERFARLERELIRAYVAGTASARECRRARRLIAADPHAGALARELLALHRGTAAALPVPALDEVGDISVLERLGQVAASLRERLSGTGEATPEELAAQLGASGAGRAAGAAGGGILAHLGLAGGAGKVVLACVGAGAVTTACVFGGAFSGQPADLTHANTPQARTPDLRVPAFDPALVARRPASAPNAADQGSHKQPMPKPESSDGDSVAPAVSPSTPAVEQEFGVASAAPAPSPADAPGGAASSTDVQEEFGP